MGSVADGFPFSVVPTNRVPIADEPGADREAASPEPTDGKGTEAGQDGSTAIAVRSDEKLRVGRINGVSMATNTDGDAIEGRLDAVAERLGIPQNTIQITRVRLDRLEAEPDVEEAAMHDVAAAALALSSREDGLPITDTEIVEAWAEVGGEDPAGAPDRGAFGDQVASIAGALEIEAVPPQPTELVWEYGERLDMEETLIAAATRLFRDLFEVVPTVVANGTRPASTVAAVLLLAADVNETDGVTLRELGDASGAGEVTVRNRYRDLREAYESADLAADRYEIDGDAAVARPGQRATATDGTGEPGAGTAPADAEGGEAAPAAGQDGAGQGQAEQSLAEDGTAAGRGGAEQGQAEQSQAEDGTAAGQAATEADGQVETGADEAEASTADITVDAVEDEIDALSDELSIDPSVRLFARGMVSDAVGDVVDLRASELAGAALVAGARREDADLDATDVADSRDFDARAISRALDQLDDAIDVDIPRRDPGEFVEELTDALDVPATAREEADRALAGFEVGDEDYTARELAAGAVGFAVTVGSADADVDAVADAAGANVEYVSAAMSDVLVAQCLGLVSGDVTYEECSWTGDLLASDLPSAIGDSTAGPAISVAMTYVAGREGEPVDGETLEVLLEGDAADGDGTDDHGQGADAA